MANKNQKANDANWMAILQAFQGTPQGNAAAVASTMMSDIKRDGADQGDLHRNAANVVFAQANDPITFTENMFMEHRDMLPEITDYIKQKKLNVSTIPELVSIIPQFLSEKRKYAEGGQFEESEKRIDVKIGEETYHLLVAETEEQKEQGLMNVSEMDKNEGMLFDYSDDPQPELSF